jgi:NADH:ubiquinone oxidoreductase subunit 3 (subunit A)
MYFLIEEYLPIFYIFIVSISLALIILGASFFLGNHKPDSQKVSAYECGFNPFEDARNQFDVRFYLVAILFIIFDLEVSFLFP